MKVKVHRQVTPAEQYSAARDMLKEQGCYTPTKEELDKVIEAEGLNKTEVFNAKLMTFGGEAEDNMGYQVAIVIKEDGFLTSVPIHEIQVVEEHLSEHF